MKLFFFIIYLCLASPLMPMSPGNLFKDHINPVFVETGTHLGSGTFEALNAGYSEIHTIEVYLKSFKAIQPRFAPHPQIHSHLGDSAQDLWDIIEPIEERITFWLDAHFSGGGTGNNGKSYCPLLEELDQIGRHSIKTHTILIDDIRLCSTPEFEYITLADLKTKILQINPEYKFKRADGGNRERTFKNDILVAYVEN